MNKLNINGINAVISFDSDINLFRGEFVGLNGYAD
jgi:predicted HicB family RNase H-like nuclease